jgi:hypothetical protein
MFEAQQEILRARRGEIDKDERESKDAAKKKAKEAPKSKTLVDRVDAAAKEDAAMHVDEVKEQDHKLRFPWQK